jgi:hypothetical protein
MYMCERERENVYRDIKKIMKASWSFDMALAERFF